MAPPKYEFDAAFQTKIAAMVLRDPRFMQRVEGLIRPDYFENGVEAHWVNTVTRYFDKYKRIPADETTLAHILKADIASKVIDQVVAGMMVQHYKTVLLATDISDRDLVIDEVASFARHQAVTTAIMESVPDLDRRDFDRISKRLKMALDVGASTGSDIYVFGENIDRRAVEREERARGVAGKSGISTGYPEIDAVLYHRGWGLSELTVLMGGAKAGKTTALIDFALQGVKQKKNVLYVTLEVAAKIVAERSDANISSTPVMELGQHVLTVKSKVQDFMTASGAHFVIKEFPTGSARVSDLRRLLEHFKARGIVFDMLVVDYADIMAPEVYTDNQQENSKSIYVGLRGLAMEEGFALLTATQTNREGFKAAVAKAEHVAEDFNKIRIADLIISINRTDEERAAGQCRLYFAASRNQAGGFSIRVAQSLDKMQFVTRVIGME